MNHIIYFCLLFFMSIIVILLIIVKAQKNKTIQKIKNIAKRINTDQEFHFQTNPMSELNDVDQYLEETYLRIKEVQQDLIIERDKLYKHLQIAQEGLAVFNAKRECIVVNDLFIQYLNMILEHPSTKAEDILFSPFFERFSTFLDEHYLKSLNATYNIKDTIVKDGKTYNIHCMIFDDNSFEISVNDITAKEEEAKIKKQLTQNIAHELKTPVSSIQGYMETLLTHPEISDEKRNFFIERSYKQSLRLSELVSDIATLTKMETDKNNEDLIEVD